MFKLFFIIAVILFAGCDPSTPAEDAGADAGEDAGELCDLGWYDGDLVIATQEDADASAGFQSVWGSLIIACPTCANLDSLSCITALGGELQIFGNENLTDLGGLSGITEICGMEGDGLRMYDNPLISDCEACDILDRLIAVPTVIEVHDNLDECAPVPDGC